MNFEKELHLFFTQGSKLLDFIDSGHCSPEKLKKIADVTGLIFTGAISATCEREEINHISNAGREKIKDLLKQMNLPGGIP